jgi:hypothetical protein
LETELAVYRPASELLGKVVLQEAVRGDGGEGCRCSWPPESSGCPSRVTTSSAAGPSARAVRHALLTDLIRDVHVASRGSHGVRRVHAELTYTYRPVSSTYSRAAAWLRDSPGLTFPPGNNNGETPSRPRPPGHRWAKPQPPRPPSGRVPTAGRTRSVSCRDRTARLSRPWLDRHDPHAAAAHVRPRRFGRSDWRPRGTRAGADGGGRPIMVTARRPVPVSASDVPTVRAVAGEPNPPRAAPSTVLPGRSAGGADGLLPRSAAYR